MQRRQKRCVNPGSAKDFVRPLPPRHVEHQRARGVRHVDGPLTRQPEAHIVFRQHHGAHARPILGFVLPHPQQLGQREVGQCRIARQLNNPLGADLRIQVRALLLCANVAPDQCWTNHFTRSVQQHRSVHLSGEADASNFLRTQIRSGESLAGRATRSAPPVLGLLLRPANLRRSKRLVLFRGGGGDPPLRVHQQSPRAARAHVDAEKILRHKTPPCCRLRVGQPTVEPSQVAHNKALTADLGRIGPLCLGVIVAWEGSSVNVVILRRADASFALFSAAIPDPWPALRGQVRLPIAPPPPLPRRCQSCSPWRGTCS